jgi:hypothetical protein
MKKMYCTKAEVCQKCKSRLQPEDYATEVDEVVAMSCPHHPNLGCQGLASSFYTPDEDPECACIYKREF